MSKTLYFTNPHLLPSASSQLTQQTDLTFSAIDLCVETISLCLQKWQQSLSDNYDGGIYVGLGGLGYALCRVASTNKLVDQEQKSKLLQSAKEIIDLHVSYSEAEAKAKHAASFILGPAGVYFVAACIYSCLGENVKCEEFVARYAKLFQIVVPIDFLRSGSDELFVGRAGYLCGVLNFRHKLGQQVIADDKVDEICCAIVKSGVEYSQLRQSPCPLMYAYHDSEYLGAAHGLCSILQMLLSFPSFLNNHTSHAHYIRSSVDYLLGIQTDTGNFPSTTDEIGHSRRRGELVHWCHGAPGTIYLFARAFLVWKDDKYLQACRRCGDVIWEKGLLKKGPGICHGVAGNGYALLLLYRLTKDESYLRKAIKFGQFMQSKEFKDARTPDSPYSLYEGLAGTACFYSDLCDPDFSEFPLFPVIFDI